jgi:integrase/recombinase XerD
MIEQYFKKPETWDRIRACWLVEPIQRYVAWLHEQAYAPRNIHGRVPILIHFAEYARDQGAKSWAGLPRHVQAFVDDWLKDRKGNIRGKRTRNQVAREVRGPVEQMLRVVLPGFVGSGRPRQSIPFANQVPAFIHHLLQERGLSARTVEEYSIPLRTFETHLKRIGHPALADLSPSILSRYITKYGQVGS